MEIIEINDNMLAALHLQAEASERKRMNFDLRTTVEDGSQRMLNAFVAFSRMLSSLSAAIVKGMQRLRMTVRTNTLMAVLALMPNCSQSWSNFAFCTESKRTVIAVCAIILLF